MSCPGIPCTPAPPVGSWTFTANPSANRFCDDRLIGLAFSDASAGTSLTVIDPVTGCLTRPAAPKGTWQHDPDGCQPDFVGPLDAPELINLPALDDAKAHGIPMLEKTCGEAVSNLIQQVPTAGNLGQPAMLREECCTNGTRWSVMAPEYLTNGRQTALSTCVSPRVLAYIPYERTVCDGKVVTEFRWYAMDKWQQAAVDPVVEDDIFDPEEDEDANITLAVWRTESCSGGGSVNQLVSMGPEKFRSLIPQESPFSFTRPRIEMLANGTPNLGTFAPSTVNYDVTSIPGYDESYTAAIVEIRMQGFTHTKVWEIYVTVDGEEYSRISLGVAEASDSDQVQIIVPIPVTKILNLQCLETVYSAGTIGPCGIHVSFSGFVK